LYTSSYLYRSNLTIAENRAKEPQDRCCFFAGERKIWSYVTAWG